MADYHFRQSDTARARGSRDFQGKREVRVLHVPFPEGVMPKVPFELAEFRHMTAEAIAAGHTYDKVVIVQREGDKLIAKRVVKENGYSCKPYDEPL